MSSISWLKKPVPAWIFLVGLIIAASLTTALVFVPALLAPKPDFELSASPASQILLTHQLGSFEVQITSINNFTGVLSAKVDQASWSVISLYVLPYTNLDTIPLYHSATLHVDVSPITVGNYTVTVTVSSGKLSHSVGFSVVVQGLVISSSPNPLTVPYGSRRNETLTLTSQNGLSGNLTVGAGIPGRLPDGSKQNSVVVDQISPTVMKLLPGGTVSTNIDINATIGDWCGADNCAIAGSADVSVSVGVRGEMGVSGTTAYTFREMINESLTMPSYHFSSGTNVTVSLRNTGSKPVLVGSYVISDSQGDQYSGYPQNGFLYVNPNSTFPVGLFIGAACWRCTLTGSAFTFETGQTYTVVVITGRYNQFAFNAAR